MSEIVKIISPVDGSVYAERPVARDAEIEAALSSARTALPAWRAVSISERARYMLAFLDALLAMNDDIAVELAWQMGRPVRYGGEKGGAEERVRAMAALAEEALQPLLPAGEGGLPPLYRARAGRHRDGHRAVELSIPHRDQYHRARRCSPAMPIILKHAAQTLLVGERFAEAFRRAGLPKGLFHNLVMSHEQTEKLHRLGPDRPHQFHRLGRRRTRHRARRRRHFRFTRA